MNNLHLLGILIIFLTGLLLGYGFGNKKEEMVKGDGARGVILLEQTHQSTQKEEIKIDSLEVSNRKINSRIKKVKQSRIKLHEEYKKDTANLNTLEFDSLSKLFTEHFPRTEYK